MITTAEQYNANLHILHTTNPPTYAALPSPENIYNIDIKRRVVDPPQFLGVEKDHAAETIYFIVDRYANYIDLANTSCIITYTTAKKQTYFYSVPFYDIYTYINQSKMIVPWNIEASVLEAPGIVEFSIMFFITKEDEVTGEIIVYSLNTLPAQSRVLEGMVVQPLKEEYKLNLTQYQELLGKINNESTWSKSPLTWTILD